MSLYFLLKYILTNMCTGIYAFLMFCILNSLTPENEKVKDLFSTADKESGCQLLRHVSECSNCFFERGVPVL